MSDDPDQAPEGATALQKGIVEEETERTRLSNAYPGAENSIGSIYQRRWFLSLDRVGSGFEPVTDFEGVKTWRRVVVDDNEGERNEGGFVVLGREVERSVVTGRMAEEVLSDEGVEGFVGRRGWRGVVE